MRRAVMSMVVAIGMLGGFSSMLPGTQSAAEAHFPVARATAFGTARVVGGTARVVGGTVRVVGTGAAIGARRVVYGVPPYRPYIGGPAVVVYPY